MSLLPVLERERLMSGSTTPLILAPSDQRWLVFVESHPQASIFQHPAWLSLLAECYGYSPMVLAVLGEDGAIQAGCPMMELKQPFRGRRWVALPFSDHCAPLYNDTRDLHILIQWLVKRYQDGDVAKIEIRWELPIPSCGHASTYDVLSRIKLCPDSSVVADQFHYHHTRQLKKAQKNRSIRIERGTGINHIQQFYDLHVQTRRRLGVPVQPKRFFRLLGDHMLQPGLGYIALAYNHEECVSANVFLQWKNTITYKYSAGTDVARDLRANYLLIWDAIQWGCENGYTWLDLGRSEQANIGLRKFKEQWGAEEIPLTYTSFPCAPSDPRQSRLIPILHSIIRHSPTWVCRITGEILYRHFG